MYVYNTIIVALLLSVLLPCDFFLMRVGRGEKAALGSSSPDTLSSSKALEGR